MAKSKTPDNVANPSLYAKAKAKAKEAEAREIEKDILAAGRENRIVQQRRYATA